MHLPSQLLSIHLHLLFVRTLLILQKWYPLVFVILLCIEKIIVIFSEKEMNKESICAKGKGGRAGGRGREKKR